MLQRIFSTNSPYKKRARLLAILWTLLIFIACFLPSNEVPEVNVPFADKWAHFILFGVFTFLWLCAKPTDRMGRILAMLFIGVLFGGFVELLQGLLAFLGRNCDAMDMLADSFGALLGVVVFYILFKVAVKKKPGA